MYNSLVCHDTHHVADYRSRGIACRDLDAAIERYVSVFGLTVVSQETNPEQGVKEAMLATASGPSYVQLLEPLAPDTPVGKFLERRARGCTTSGTRSRT